jgi:amino acid adenylation domain-containing protein
VGIYLSKSIDAVASIFGVLMAGAAYVPVDTEAPVQRNAYILDDCSVKSVIMEKRFEERFLAEIELTNKKPLLILLGGTGGGNFLKEALETEQKRKPTPLSKNEISKPDDLAYILYTSGSTGKPKGVKLSHRNAVSFIDWCSETFEPKQNDRFSSHAPFHFDLSILDLFLPIKHGATLVLIAEDVGKDPIRLAPLISEKRITAWYSAPSILSLLAQYGKLEKHEYPALRMVLFAGEVFPIKHLKKLKNLLPGPKYYNLYGPTETNVCTYYEIPSLIPEERNEPFPIGKTCSHLKAKVVDEFECEIPAGSEGELCISGPSVMHGYWNLPEQTRNVFLQGTKDQEWYRTGDIVVEGADGNYVFLGRRDRMVKKRGFRIELGEIEAALYRHPAIKEAAVIALSDEDSGIRIKAFLSYLGEERPSIIELKRFCSENLPLYMIPDLFSFQDTLPKTSTDKIDYQRLKEII